MYPRSLPRRGTTLLWLRALVLGFVFFLGGAAAESNEAWAYSWMIRHDYTACATCHADPSGGELLTNYGRATANLILSMQYGAQADAEEPAKEPKSGLFWGAVDLPSSLLLSGSYRSLYLLRPGADDVFTPIPVMQADLYGQLRVGAVTMGGSVGAGRVSVGSPHVRAAQVTTNQGEGINLISRTHYVGVDIGSEFTLRGGRLNLPFGIRMPEHTTWVREATRTDRESDQQHGVALAYIGDNFRGELMAIAGNYQTRLEPGGVYAELSPDAVRERGYAMYLEGIGSANFAAGVSSQVTYARLDRVSFEEKTLRQAHGVTTRWGPTEKFSILGEANVLFRTDTDAGYVGWVQADYEPIQGLHFMVTGEFLDEGLPVEREGATPPSRAPGLGEPKFGAWLTVDWFFFRQFEFRTDFLLRQDEPATLMTQLHFYL